jgi:hypothetical protein
MSWRFMRLEADDYDSAFAVLKGESYDPAAALAYAREWLTS